MIITKFIEVKYHSGFSGWLRATLRQWDEDHDPVRTSILLETLMKAVRNHPDMMVILQDASDIRAQATLEVFD